MNTNPNKKPNPILYHNTKPNPYPNLNPNSNPNPNPNNKHISLKKKKVQSLANMQINLKNEEILGGHNKIFKLQSLRNVPQNMAKSLKLRIWETCLYLG